MAKAAKHPKAAPAPKAGTPAVEPAESVVTDAPPADAGGDALANAEITVVHEDAPPQRAGPGGKPLWRCHTQSQPDGLFEGDTGDDALAAYRGAYGIIASDHPFVAEPVY